MRSTNLYNMIKRFGFGSQRITQLRESRNERIMYLGDSSNMHDRRESGARFQSTGSSKQIIAYVSLLLWLILTWSLGWTGFFEPSSPPRISMARFEMTYRSVQQRWVQGNGILTSLAFMLLCVPLPV
jgi:hypothetical protein